MIHARGLGVHLRLQAKVQLRSRQSLLYGLGVPLLFLLGFGALYRAGEPPLLAQMGQLAVITILGGACFGLPTALVAEREAGMWRRHRLSRVSIFWMLAPLLVVRAAVIAAGLLLQGVLARTIWGTPLPADPAGFLLTVAFVLGVFMALGLVIAAIADSIPSVQGLGQLLFLPMIILGGVGVPVVALPDWAQKLSAFMPGRYAVEVIQASWLGRTPEGGLEIPLAALFIMGAVGWAVGLAGFRWDPLARPSWRRRLFSVATLVPWLVAGFVSLDRGAWVPTRFPAEYRLLTEEDIRSIRFDDLPGDNEFVTPIGPADLIARPSLRDALTVLATWPRAKTGDAESDVRLLVSVAALADAAQDVTERDFARAVYEHLRAHYPRGELRALLAWVALTPGRGAVVTNAPELGIRRRAEESLVRERCSLYARKYLGRVEGVITEKPVAR